MKNSKTRILLMIALAALLLTGSAAIAEKEADSAGAPLIVDLDLSSLSGTFVYAQVYNMMYEPDDYIGKVIRVAGYYSAYEAMENGVVYHACIIPDATACCAQGIEFVWEGDHVWPDDYPEEGADIIVTGRLETYDENGFTYLHLVDAVLD